MLFAHFVSALISSSVRHAVLSPLACLAALILSVPAYTQFIAESRADLGIAKHAYVATRCGWFSDRSTCYLASGRPVLHQDTGFGDWLPPSDGVLPFGAGRLVDIQLAHRLAVLLAAAAVLTMSAIALRRRVPGAAFRLAPVLLGAQILLGAVNVWAGEHATLVVAHLALATTLWATVVYGGVSLLAVPAPAEQGNDKPRSPLTAAAVESLTLSPLGFF